MPELAARLAVSKRTVRRDLDAPVGAVQAALGPNNLTLVKRDEPSQFRVPFPTVEFALTDLLLLDNQVRVVDSPAVQSALARIGADLVDTYGKAGSQAR